MRLVAFSLLFAICQDVSGVTVTIPEPLDPELRVIAFSEPSSAFYEAMKLIINSPALPDARINNHQNKNPPIQIKAWPNPIPQNPGHLQPTFISPIYTNSSDSGSAWPRNCTIPGRQYLHAKYAGDAMLALTVKLKIGTGIWAASYYGGAMDDSYKDLPMQVEQSDSWFDKGGKDFLLRSISSEGKGWLRTASTGGKCAGLSDDETHLVMWRCNKDGSYPSFFTTSDTTSTPDGQPYQVSYLFLKSAKDPNIIYRPYIHPDTMDGHARVFVDKCTPGFTVEDSTPFSGDINGGRTSPKDQEFIAKENLHFETGFRWNPEQSKKINDCLDSYLKGTPNCPHNITINGIKL